MEDVTVDLSKLTKKGGKYYGSVSINGQEKSAYGTDGSVLNILDEVYEKVADSLGCHPTDLEGKLHLGKSQKVAIMDSKVSVTVASVKVMNRQLIRAGHKWSMHDFNKHSKTVVRNSDSDNVGHHTIHQTEDGYYLSNEKYDKDFSTWDDLKSYLDRTKAVFIGREKMHASIKASLIKAGIEVSNEKIRRHDVDKALRVLTAATFEPEFMGEFVEALEAKGYKLGGHADMWRSPSVDDHTSTNVSDAGGDKLNVRLRFNPDGKKVTQKVVHDDPEDSDSWYFDYVIKDESEVKSVVHDVCKALKCKVTKFKIFQNMANFEMTKPEGLDIPFKMMAR